MKVSDIFGNNQISNNKVTAQGRGVTGQEALTRQSDAGTGAQAGNLKEFTPGQIIRGELVNTGDAEVKIKLSNNTMLQARLDQNILLEPGKMMNFQVRSNGQTLMLTPLQANLSVEGPVFKALEMANLPINSATGELTELLMKAGLPIDKNHLQQVYREMVNSPNGQISDLVDLHRLGLPVTEENLNQISSYKNLTHQLISGLHQTSEEVYQSISGLQEQGDPSKAAALFHDVITVMSEETAEIADLESAGTPAGQSIQGALQEELNSVLSKEEGMHESNGKLEGFSSAQLESAGMKQEQITEALDQILKREGFTETEKLDLVKTMLKEAALPDHQELAKALLNSNEVKKLLANQFDKQWTITPEQVQDPKEVENLYHRLTRQLKGLATALESANQTQTGAYQSCTSMNQNLDFLNQINHLYSYVQLPLKLQQGEAHGDLYVYTRKKNLAMKDEPITALLHLDMEHLGPVDVFVTMQDQKVGTKFTVGDDETLDFLEEHMDLLTTRLEKRGYQLSVQTSVKSKEDPEKNSGIMPIINKESPGMMIQSRGFDMRT